jgi:hypothetical protein
MISSTELRIGNLIYSITGTIFALSAEDIRCIDDGEDNDMCAPIPITEELLLKAGFGMNQFTENGSQQLHADFDVFRLYLRDGEVSIHYNTGQGWFPVLVHGIKYIHRLQNIFFELCGEELTFNL